MQWGTMPDMKRVATALICGVFMTAMIFAAHFTVMHYVVVWLLLMMTVLWVHMKASNSRAIQNAQRSLHLVPQLKYHS